MFLSRLQVFIIVITSHIFLPILLFAGILLWGTYSLLHLIAVIIFMGNFTILIYKVGYWEFTWYYTRYVIMLISRFQRVKMGIGGEGVPIVFNNWFPV